MLFLNQLGCNSHEFFNENLVFIKDQQTVDGRFFLNDDDHVGPLRAFVSIEPKSVYTLRGLNYFIEKIVNPGDFSDYIKTYAIGGLALSESNYYLFQSEIEKVVSYLQNLDEGTPCYICADFNYSTIKNISYSIELLSRILGPEHESVIKGVNYLIEHQNPDGSFLDPIRPSLYYRGTLEYNADTTAIALIALISAGGGPKISQYEHEWKIKLEEQKIDFIQPKFLHTSPLYNSQLHVKEIYEKIHNLIHSSKKKIKICSPYLDILYEDLINKANDCPELELKVITKPPKDISGLRERIGKNVIELLNIASKGNLKTNPLIHARLIIFDDNKMIISSADITRDQLFDEFNSGIYTQDLECVKCGIDFFDNLWSLSDSRS